jgi:hypothetical protein
LLTQSHTAALHYPRSGERASRRFIEFFTANIRNRNTRILFEN